MASATDFYQFTAYISPDFIKPGTKITKKLRRFLTANEMKNLEMAYNTTKTNSVEVIYRHRESGEKTQDEMESPRYRVCYGSRYLESD